MKTVLMRLYRSGRIPLTVVKRELRADAERREQIRSNFGSLSWWWRFFSCRVLPVFFIAFFGWSVGFVNGATYLAKETVSKFDCVERSRNGDF